MTQKSSGTYRSERNCTAHTIHKLAVIITRGKTDAVASVNDLMPTMKGWYLTRRNAIERVAFTDSTNQTTLFLLAFSVGLPTHWFLSFFVILSFFLKDIFNDIFAVV